MVHTTHRWADASEERSSYLSLRRSSTFYKLKLKLSVCITVYYYDYVPEKKVAQLKTTSLLIYQKMLFCGIRRTDEDFQVGS